MSKPNFVIFLTDDQGYADLSCMGTTDFRTPHLDALATGGVRFTEWYANAPVCSPTRASILTGRYPGNAGVRSILAGHRSATGLPGHVPTIAEAMRREGYFTAMSGKWHLGLAEESRPENHGFDHWFGHMAGCIDYYSHIFYWDLNRPGSPGNGNPHDLWEDGTEVWRNGEYMTEMITDRAVDYIRQARHAEKPFFLYVAYNAPHYPMHAPAKYLDRFKHLPPDRRIMAAMISALDDGVGDIVAELERQGIREDTCILFSADNGPSREPRNWLDGRQDPYYGGSAGGFKGEKFSLYEGGLRVPAIANWPGHIPAGQVLDGLAASMDVFPTVLAAAGGELSQYELDGRDLMPMMAKGAGSPHERLFFEQSGQIAVREGPYKLVLNGELLEGGGVPDEVHLADLSSDPGERTNLKDDKPEVTAQLRAAAEEWMAGIEKRWRDEFGQQ
jgi:arylsulfatase A-like enzyme